MRHTEFDNRLPDQDRHRCKLPKSKIKRDKHNEGKRLLTSGYKAKIKYACVFARGKIKNKEPCSVR